jgi:uncharacterized protein DUF642
MKISKITVFVASTLALMSGLSATHASSLLINGSFENITNFSDNTGQDTMTVNVGDSTTMPGWTVVGQAGRTAAIAWIGPTNPFGLSASNGSYFLDLTGYQNGGPFGGVQQTVATAIGSIYRLTFDLGSSSSYGTPTGIVAEFNGVHPASFTSTLTGSNNWETESVLFTAGSLSTVISLIGNQGNNYIGLDNVSVNFVSSSATPIPAALPLFAGGLGLIGLVARRRKKQVQAA